MTSKLMNVLDKWAENKTQKEFNDIVWSSIGIIGFVVLILATGLSYD